MARLKLELAANLTSYKACYSTGTLKAPVTNQSSTADLVIHIGTNNRTVVINDQQKIVNRLFEQWCGSDSDGFALPTKVVGWPLFQGSYPANKAVAVLLSALYFQLSIRAAGGSD